MRDNFRNVADFISLRKITLISWAFAIAIASGGVAQSADVPVVLETRVQLVAVRKPVISAEIAGRVTTLNYRAGQSFIRDATLVTFDCGLHEAREARAVAQRDRAQRQLNSLRHLDRSGATSRLELGIAMAEMSAAEAELRVAQITVQRCAIRAPFAGRLVEQRVQPGEYVAEGQPVVEIIDESELEFEMLVPSDTLIWLRIGSISSVLLHELGGSVEAQVTRISPLIDPVSRAVKLYARGISEDNRLMAGMSGVASFRRPEASR